jgi:hypothetical protein
MLEQTKNKSLDELEEFMGWIGRKFADDDIQDDGSGVGSDELGAEVGVDERGADIYRPSRSAGMAGVSWLLLLGNRMMKGVEGVSWMRASRL